MEALTSGFCAPAWKQRAAATSRESPQVARPALIVLLRSTIVHVWVDPAQHFVRYQVYYSSSLGIVFLYRCLSVRSTCSSRYYTRWARRLGWQRARPLILEIINQIHSHAHKIGCRSSFGSNKLTILIVKINYSNYRAINCDRVLDKIASKIGV